MTNDVWLLMMFSAQLAVMIPWAFDSHLTFFIPEAAIQNVVGHPTKPFAEPPQRDLA